MADLKEQSRQISLSKLLRWYIGLYRKDRVWVICAAILAFVQSVLLVPIPILFGKIVDDVIPAKDVGWLLKIGGAALTLYVLHGTIAFTSRSLGLMATKRVTESLRARLCMQLQQMSLTFHDEERASELHSRVVLDTERIDVMGNAALIEFTAAAMMFLSASVILAMVNLKLFLVVCIMLPVYYLCHSKLKRRMRDVHRGFRDAMESMGSQINDLLQSIRLVKTFAREEHEQQRAEDQFHTVTRRALDMTLFTAFYVNFMNLLTNTTMVLIYVVGGYIIIQEAMTVGDLIAFAGMVGFMVAPIGAMLNLMQMIYSGLASLGPVYTLLHYHDPLEKLEGTKEVEAVNGSIEFQDVTLVYTTSGRHALRDVSVDIKPGETIALVGESGAGKSTFANLVLGFYFPAEGKVLIDGEDVTSLNVRRLRDKIGVVSQDNVLLNTSIRENLLYGKLTATEEELREAARNANALEFIEEIPSGFDAIVGDRGTRLSGGQRQRLAIARALLKNPRILILDEATSALDSESEAKIQEALDRLRVSRTCLIIAHRLSTIMSADRILVFKDGSLVESGTHRELVKLGGEYAHLCERQFGQVMKDLERIKAKG